MKERSLFLLGLVSLFLSLDVVGQCDPPKGLDSSTFVLDLCPDTAVYNKFGNPASPGDSVYEWHSIDDNNWVFENTKNDRRPVLDTVDGYRYLRFEDGAFLENQDIKDSINGLNEFSIYSVIKSNVTGTNHGIFFWKYPPDGQDDGLCLRYDDQGANTGRNDVIKTGLLGNTPGNQIETTSNTQTTDRQVLTITWSDGDKLYSYIDGMPNDSSDNNVSGPMSGTQTLLIGKGAKDGGVSDSWDGNIGRMIFYNDEHPPDTVQKISNILPVELLSFDAEPGDEGVRIRWSTATEQRNDRFEVQRSTDGEKFTSIATVDGAGSSTSRRDYAVLDRKPLKGVSYYRLKQVDMDGKSKTFAPAAVRYAGNDERIEVYPNPVKGAGKLNVRLDGGQQKEVLVVLRDVHGKKRYSKVVVTGKNGSALTAVDLRDRIPSGIYFIIASSNDAMYRRKVVVE